MKWCRRCTLLLVFVVACGGQVVKPLDPRDTTLPMESRRLLSDVEDGILVARAQLDGARRRLEQTRQTRDELLASERWGRDVGLRKGLDQLFDARLSMGESHVDVAKWGLRYAEVKYQLVTAERAMLHDLGRYDLQPLRAEVDGVRDRLDEAQGELQRMQDRLAATTRSFWQQYATLAGRSRAGTQPFWVGP